MNEDLKRDLVFFIINELKNIQADMLIDQALTNDDDDDKHPENLFEVLQMLKDDLRNQVNSANKLHFNNGMFEAYSKILSKLDARI
jgi:hypothetical protein